MSKIILNGIEYSNGIIYQELQPVIYSTEEREIGVWTDGKPLYQKTWDFGSAITVNSNTWTDTSISNSNIEAIMKVVGGNLFSGKISCFDGLSATADTGSVVKILQSRNLAISVRYLTLQYTKTTDTAGSGSWNTDGIPMHHYSTNEQVIGTWIDGKPLYECTIDGLSIPVSMSWTAEVATNLNIKFLVNATLYDNSNPTNPIIVNVEQVQVLNGGFRISHSNNNSGRTITRAVIQYTKTTD